MRTGCANVFLLLFIHIYTVGALHWHRSTSWRTMTARRPQNILFAVVALLTFAFLLSRAGRNVQDEPLVLHSESRATPARNLLQTINNSTLGARILGTMDSPAQRIRGIDKFEVLTNSIFSLRKYSLSFYPDEQIVATV
jgi:hypothetical protein